MGEAQRYQVVERIAAGGMAEVYRGESAGIEGFRKKVAIKRVLPKLSANREFINMFLDEARLCAYLSHSRCVQVFDIGQAAGSHFIVMEYVDGADLQGVLEYLTERGQRMPVEAACLITQNVCEGLAYAHEAADHTGAPLNIVHRDISPHNVLMTRYGEVKLVDFGLAKASSHLTAEDEDIVKGKFGYLAPEVTMGKGSDRRVDIFAAGILLWEMLAGRRLFKGESDLETFKLVQAAHIPDIRELRPEVSAELTAVLNKALARDPEQRYGNADDFASDLARIMAGLERSVTYLDVKKLVSATAGERAKRRKAQSKDTAGVIGDLIIGALHDFSAEVNAAELHKGTTTLGEKGLSPLSGDFVDPSQWGLDALFDEAPKPVEPAPPVAAAAAEPEEEEDFELSEDDVHKASVRPKAAPPAAAAAKARPAPPPAGAAAPGKKEEGGPWWRRWFGS
jgi:eukaryotic-like serine/threonine-protein kinase